MIYSLTKIFSDMIYFLMVFTVFILGFASSFYTLSDSYQSPIVLSSFDSFKMSYQMAIGDFDTGNFDKFTWFYFFAASIIELIILLNLLIAIISDSFKEV